MFVLSTVLYLTHHRLDIHDVCSNRLAEESVQKASDYDDKPRDFWIGRQKKGNYSDVDYCCCHACHFLSPIRRILAIFYSNPSDQLCGNLIFYFNIYVVASIEISSAANIVIYMLCVKRYRKKVLFMCQTSNQIEPMNESSLGADTVQSGTTYQSEH